MEKTYSLVQTLIEQYDILRTNGDDSKGYLKIKFTKALFSNKIVFY